MDLLFLTEARFSKSLSGRFYYNNESYSHHMFNRYLDVFDNIFVIARTCNVQPADFNENLRVDTDKIHVLPLPFYIGPYQFLTAFISLNLALKQYLCIHPSAAVICRVPGIIGTIGAKHLRNMNRSYGVEVVGCPWDVFSPGSIDHPLRSVFRYVGVYNLKQTVKSASAALYVSKSFLQQRYPIPPNRYNTYASDVMLPFQAFSSRYKQLDSKKQFSIVAVGTLDAMYKAPDIAIRAIKLLKDKGLDICLKWIGGGRHLSQMSMLARDTGVEDAINFVGSVPTSVEVSRYLDSADLFILPSRQEGLPRALLEAMARGLPCIATNVGGIPELLDEIALLPANSPVLLANKIYQFLTNPPLADQQARRNLERAREYSKEVLDSRRKAFYQHLESIS